MLLDQRDIDLAMSRWPQISGARATLINVSENQIYCIDTTSGERYALRVHRPDYQSNAAIKSELAWLEALRHDTDLRISEPVPVADGATLQTIATPNGDIRHLALFRFVAGSEPSPNHDLTELFFRLGGYAARLHRHAIDWQRPAWFERPVWDGPSILDGDGLWGNWRTAPGVNAEITAILLQVDAALRVQLLAYGTSPERFGLIHADMRLGNLLVDDGAVTLLDFDDSGFCWFAYDFAAAISFHEAQANIAALKAAWLRAYLPLRQLCPEDIAMMDTMVMLRRMALLAWIGTHSETRLAQTHVNGFAEGTAELGRRYLNGKLVF